MKTAIIFFNILIIAAAPAATPAFSRPSYEIEAAYNDEWFIINGEKFQAKTYCIGWEGGDRVVFLQGSLSAVFVSAELYNITKEQLCSVWCE